MQQNLYYNQANELDEELNIDFKKFFMVFWSRKEIISKIFIVVLVFFILLTFIMPKKYKVDADLYINKSNNTNLMEINPYAIEELGAMRGGMAAMMSSGSGLTNELEIMLSPLVMDKVVRDNDMKYRKKWGIIPNEREGEYIPGYAIAKSKNLSIENKKGTNIVTIEFKSKNPKVAYNIVCSIIANYIDISRQLHSEKAKNDTKILEAEYNKVKANLNEKISNVSAIPPTTTIGGGVNLNAMGAFSKPAQMAIASVTNQYKIGTKTNLAVQEESAKMSDIAKKLQWAKMVEEMSESSNVLILKEPALPKDSENISPKLQINILLGIIFGIIVAFWTVIFLELTSKKVSYLKLDDNIIYKDETELFNIQKFLLDYKNQNIACIIFDNPEQNIVNIMSEFKNLNIIKATISTSLIDNIIQSDSAILLLSIDKTDAMIYKSIKETLKIHKKQILKEILI